MSSQKSPAKVNAYPHLLPIDHGWLATYEEEMIEPDLPIVDAHHHLWDMPGWHYMPEQLRADLAAGHNVRATVFVQASMMYRTEGPEEFKPVGETEFANGIAAMGASGWFGSARACAGIVGFVDLRLGERVRPVLEAHIQAGGGRFRGVRFVTSWDEDSSVFNAMHSIGPKLLGDPKFREGIACLSPLGLSFDSVCFHTQLPELAELAKAFPETGIILNHIGMPVRIGRFAGNQKEVFDAWRKALAQVAQCSNVVVKIGGLGLRSMGFGFYELPAPPSSAVMAEAWRPWIETTIELFGARRAMFESNFPADKVSTSYRTVWNAFKRLASRCSADDKARLFSGSAIEAYRLDLP